MVYHVIIQTVIYRNLSVTPYFPKTKDVDYRRVIQRNPEGITGQGHRVLRRGRDRGRRVPSSNVGRRRGSLGEVGGWKVVKTSSHGGHSVEGHCRKGSWDPHLKVVQGGHVVVSWRDRRRLGTGTDRLFQTYSRDNHLRDSVGIPIIEGEYKR